MAGYIQKSFQEEGFELYISTEEPELNETYQRYFQILGDNWDNILTNIRLVLLEEVRIEKPDLQHKSYANIELNILFFPKVNCEDYDAELNFDSEGLKFAALLIRLKVKEIIIHN